MGADGEAVIWDFEAAWSKHQFMKSCRDLEGPPWNQFCSLRKWGQEKQVQTACFSQENYVDFPVSVLTAGPAPMRDGSPRQFSLVTAHLPAFIPDINFWEMSALSLAIPQTPQSQTKGKTKETIEERVPWMIHIINHRAKNPMELLWGLNALKLTSRQLDMYSLES